MLIAPTAAPRLASIALAPAALALAVLIMARPAAAHDFWLSEAEAAPGAPVVLNLGYGHDFPVGEAIPDENLATRFQAMTLEGPGGPFALGRGASNELLVGDKPLEEGLYLAHGSTTPLFLTQTTEGWAIKAKDEVEAPITANLSTKYSKAVIRVGRGGGGQAPDRLVGHKLEMALGADPAGLKAGDGMPVLVVFAGAPLAGAEVKATAAGEKAPSTAVKTGSDGRAVLPLDRPGLWLLMVEHSIPYDGDRSKADNELNIATLTFRVPD